MTTNFLKMHGLGNDFAIFDARQAEIPLPPNRVRRLADRHMGIGCDQLIRLEPSEKADVFMRIFNADGSESGACGNATRCVAALLGGAVTIETRSGILSAEPAGEEISVDMGPPRWSWQEVPLAHAADTLELPVSWDGLERPSAVSMGNPHVVFFVADASEAPLAALGPIISVDPLFPEGANVNAVSLAGPDHLLLRVYERGAGLTLACGSGACASFAAARRRRLVGRRALLSLPGGDLQLEEGADGHIRMTGPVATSFRGETAL